MFREHSMQKQTLVLHYPLQHTADGAYEYITLYLDLFKSLAASILISREILETRLFCFESSDLQSLEAISRNKRLFLDYDEMKPLLFFNRTLICIAEKKSELIPFKA